MRLVLSLCLILPTIAIATPGHSYQPRGADVPTVGKSWFQDHAPLDFARVRVLSDTVASPSNVDVPSLILSDGRHEVQQMFASPDGPKPRVPSPPLEIEPLVVSGPASNRVDLVFFSDGCAYSLRHNRTYAHWICRSHFRKGQIYGRCYASGC